VGARALVFAAIVASAASSMIATASTFPLIPPPASSGIQGVARVMDGTDTLMYWDRNAPSIVAWWLVDRHVLAMLS
jgi:hypothetical protein